MRRVVRRLPNGLELVGVPYPGLPIAALRLHLRVGSADEGDRERGLAHVLEHLVVRCSMRGGRVGNGPLVTARTGKEHTGYTVVVLDAGDRVARAATALGAAFHDLDVPAPVLTAELAAIRQERAERAGDAGRRLRDALFARLWPGTSYAHPVLGDPHVPADLTVPAVRTFHTAWYRPSNAVLAVVSERAAEYVADLADPALPAGTAGTAHATARRGDGGPEPAPRPAAEPCPGTVVRTETREDGRAVVGFAFADETGDETGDEPVHAMARQAVRAATGVTVEGLTLRRHRCTWVMVVGPDTGTAREGVASALRATRRRLREPDGAAWLHAEALIPLLRGAGDVETLAMWAAAPRTVALPPDLAAVDTGAVTRALDAWEARLAVRTGHS